MQTPIQATRPLLQAFGIWRASSDAVRVYPDRGDSATSPYGARWTVAAPNCPNEVWIRRRSNYDQGGRYQVSHRHSGYSFPRVFAPLACEQPTADGRGWQVPDCDTFAEAYALAVQLAKAYSAR